MINRGVLFLLAAMTVAAMTLWWAIPQNLAGPIIPLAPSAPAPVAELIAETHAAIRTKPRSVARWIVYGETLHANGYEVEAAQAYRSGLRLDSDDVGLWYRLGDVEERRGDRTAALAAFEQAAEHAPDDVTTQWRLGFLRLEDGQLDAAQTHFDAAERQGSRAEAPRYGSVRVALVRGDVERALGFLEKMIDDTAHPEYAHHLMADALRRLGRGEDAARAARRATPRPPTWPDPHLRTLATRRPGYGAKMAMARGLLAGGDHDAAIEILETLAREHRRRPMVYVTLGRACREAGRWRESVDALEAAIGLDDTLYAAHFELAVTLAELSQRTQGPSADTTFRRAVTEVRRALVLNAAYAPAHALLGDFELLDGAIESALTQFETAVTLDGSDPRWARRRGITLVRLARWAEASAVLAPALDMDSDNADAWRAYAFALAYQGQFDEAAVAVNAARERGGDPTLVDAAEQLVTRLREEGG